MLAYLKRTVVFQTRRHLLGSMLRLAANLASLSLRLFRYASTLIQQRFSGILDVRKQRDEGQTKSMENNTNYRWIHRYNRIEQRLFSKKGSDLISNLLENLKTHIYSPFLVSSQSQHSAETTVLEIIKTSEFLNKLQNNLSSLWGPVLQLLKNIQFNLTLFHFRRWYL